MCSIIHLSTGGKTQVALRFHILFCVGATETASRGSTTRRSLRRRIHCLCQKSSESLCLIRRADMEKLMLYQRYELRFPRLSKLYRRKERDWTCAVTAQELHEIARKACGRDPSEARYARQAAALFRSSTIHKSVRCLDNVAERAKDFIQRLPGRKTNQKRRRDKDDSDSISSSYKRTKKDASPHKGTDYSRSLSLLTPRPSPALKPIPMSKSEPNLAVSSTLQDEFKRKTMWHLCHSITRAESRSWKARLSPFNHIHDLDGLLQGCGWLGDARSPWCERGLIVVNAENRAAVESHVEKVGSRTGVSRVPVWVVEVDALFENLESHARIFV